MLAHPSQRRHQQRDQHRDDAVEDEAREILRGAVLSQRTQANGTGKLGSRIAARFAGAGIEGDIPELRGHAALPPTLAR